MDQMGYWWWTVVISGDGSVAGMGRAVEELSDACQSRGAVCMVCLMLAD